MKALLGLWRLVKTAKASFKSTARAQDEGGIKAPKWQDSFVCVLPTGGGKPTAFFVPATLEHDDKMTMIVAPFVALLDDMERCAKKAGFHSIIGTIKHLRMVSRNTFNFFSFRLATSALFISACRYLESERHISRVVVDKHIWRLGAVASGMWCTIWSIFGNWGCHRFCWQRSWPQG